MCSKSSSAGIWRTAIAQPCPNMLFRSPWLADLTAPRRPHFTRPTLENFGQRKISENFFQKLKIELLGGCQKNVQLTDC
jgi:hypothetical protein